MWFSKCIFCFAHLPPERNIHFCGVTRVALPAHSGFLSFYMPCFFERSYMWTDAFFHTSRFFLRNSLVFSTNQTLSVKISPFRTKGNNSTISNFPHKTKQKLFRPSSRSLLSRNFMFMMEKLENIALKDWKHFSSTSAWSRFLNFIHQTKQCKIFLLGTHCFFLKTSGKEGGVQKLSETVFWQPKVIPLKITACNCSIHFTADSPQLPGWLTNLLYCVFATFS